MAAPVRVNPNASRIITIITIPFSFISFTSLIRYLPSD
jgi:hypothetical protein